MNQTASFAPALLSLPRQARDWLDGYGNRGWIAAMVLGFIFFWPLGLGLVGYMTLTNRWKDTEMFGMSRRCKATRTPFPGTSGNAAFDAYKAETLKRLEDEQAAFEGFLKRLRDAKDKQEFDAFMDDRARRVPSGAAEDLPR
ncbi:DUF2852 domain-containing protein [Falsigemmobacter faecalis]|uniref:DUF2852 domain-containing protein n=1 Tax=Falsigemmobacter faecalis TaxID=2488730 RepID=A0A3P3DLQ7_9RHOB|nr:DUF2852 domain-containing protein [Falsigemmobacter faecalis]RRH75180.1 DUF2852 domain-containing protein [Falsigemmobacter faecalis]